MSGLVNCPQFCFLSRTLHDDLTPVEDVKFVFVEQGGASSVAELADGEEGP